MKKLALAGVFSSLILPSLTLAQTPTASSVFRDWNVDGVPSSGAHNPVKGDIRAWGLAVETKPKSVTNYTDLVAAIPLGGHVIVLPGVYTLSSALIVPANTTLECQRGAILRRASGLTNAGAVPVVGISGDNIAISGCEIDMNAPASSNLMVPMAPIGPTNHVQLRDLYLHGGAFAGLYYTSAGYTWAHSDIKVENVRINNFGWECQDFEAITGGYVRGGTISSCGSHMTGVRAVHRFTVDGNNENNAVAPTIVYSGPGSFGGAIKDSFIFYGPDSTDLAITNNILNTNVSFDGIGLYENGVSCPANILIANNLISGVNGAGIDVSCNSTVSNNKVFNSQQCMLVGLDYGGPLYGAVISNNTCDNTGAAGSNSGVGIRFGHPIPQTMTITTTSGLTAATMVARAPNGAENSSGFGDYALAFTHVGQLIQGANGITSAAFVPDGTTITAVGTGGGVTLSNAATATGSFSGIAQGLTNYADITSSGNTIIDTRATGSKGMGYAYSFEGFFQSYTRVQMGDNFIDGITLGVYYPASAPTGVQVSAAQAYTPSLTWTGGSNPTAAALSGVLASAVNNQASISFTLYTGSNLNGSTGVSITTPYTTKTGVSFAFLQCIDASNNAVGLAKSVGGTTAFALGGITLTAAHYIVCSGSYPIE
jgi:hypothetical protein